MPSGTAFQKVFKAGVLRRLGSWGSTLSIGEAGNLLAWASRVIPNKDIRDRADALHHALVSSGAAGEIARGLFDLAPEVRRRFIENVLVNWGVLGGSTRYKVLDDEGWLPPAFAVISPTMRCNLRCRGCYAFEYSRDGELTSEEFDRSISQCKDLGMYFFTISGGEPFVREDLLDILKKHDDAFFQIYTNGTMIDDRVADRLLELGNAVPAISVEGFRAETDDRRGAGTHDRVVAAMDRLKARNLLFGISLTVTRQNSDSLMDDEVFDFYLDRGAKFAWLFQYVPIGRSPDVDLMSTAEQRNNLRHKVADIRERKPIFIGDFWNDGEYVGGCMAGGRLYFHITSNGSVEPCVFCHFAVGNVRERPLKEILTCDFFKAIRYEQPYRDNANLYTPCMIIDNPEVLRRLVREYNVKPSHAGAGSIVEDPVIMRHLDRYSEELRELSDREWLRDHYDNPLSEWYRDGGARLVRQWAHERASLVRWHEERHAASAREPETMRAGSL